MQEKPGCRGLEGSLFGKCILVLVGWSIWSGSRELPRPETLGGRLGEWNWKGRQPARCVGYR